MEDFFLYKLVEQIGNIVSSSAVEMFFNLSIVRRKQTLLINEYTQVRAKSYFTTFRLLTLKLSTLRLSTLRLST